MLVLQNCAEKDGRRIEAAPNVYSMMLFNAAAESCGSGKWEVDP